MCTNHREISIQKDMKLHLSYILLSVFALLGSLHAEAIKWGNTFPPVPDKHGFAGPFSGVVGEGEERFLVFGGGANFPERAPWLKDAEGNGPPKFGTALSMRLDWRAIV